MTELRWGKFKQHIAKDELLGTEARLYKTNAGIDCFIMTIE